MLWDADTAYSESTTCSEDPNIQQLTHADNDRFDLKIKNAITTGGPTSPDDDDDPSDTPSSIIPMATVSPDFRDPREKARVKRPPNSFEIMHPDKRAARPKRLSRVFRS
jgi:hypothetical protein